MTVISDTSPLRYLVVTGLVDVLPGIYGIVHCPPEVIAECCAERAPLLLKEWISIPPDWLVVMGHTGWHDPVLEQIDPGEAAAIQLAHDKGAALLLMDDRLGRQAARALGFEVTGTLGIISAAAEKGLVDYEVAIDRLCTLTNFRISPELVEAARPKNGGRSY